jgi:hypothetical protein
LIGRPKGTQRKRGAGEEDEKDGKARPATVVAAAVAVVVVVVNAVRYLSTVSFSVSFQAS